MSLVPITISGQEGINEQLLFIGIQLVLRLAVASCGGVREAGEGRILLCEVLVARAVTPVPAVDALSRVARDSGDVGAVGSVENSIGCASNGSNVSATSGNSTDGIDCGEGGYCARHQHLTQQDPTFACLSDATTGRNSQAKNELDTDEEELLIDALLAADRDRYEAHNLFWILLSLIHI